MKMAREENEEQLALMPLVKDFYREDPYVQNLGKIEVDRIREENNNIIVNTLKEENYKMVHESEQERKVKIPNPVTTFEQAFKSFPLILKKLKRQGFSKPSPIQCQAWPILLRGMDLVGIAQTGTGKTLAFLLPALIHIDGQPIGRRDRSGPACVILAPTRELAQQIDGEVHKFSYKGIRSMCIYGGASRKDQLYFLDREKADIIIATPGRLLDFIDSNKLDVSGVSFVVLDEADRMLDMGFSPQIRRCLVPMRPDKQVVMTTATWSFDAQIIARLYYKNAVKVDVGSLDLNATHSVTQKFIFLDESEKQEWLLKYASKIPKTDRVIIFISRKNDVDEMSSSLLLQGVDCESIHGGREQSDRESALHYFRSGTVNILLATDVASRGIDISDITHIVNYDFPKHLEEYVHRIGRTGRAGKHGEALTVLTRQDWQHASGLIRILEEAGQEIPRELASMAERHRIHRENRGNDRGGRRKRGGGSDMRINGFNLNRKPFQDRGSFGVIPSDNKHLQSSHQHEYERNNFSNNKIRGCGPQNLVYTKRNTHVNNNIDLNNAQDNEDWDDSPSFSLERNQTAWEKNENCDFYNICGVRSAADDLFKDNHHAERYIGKTMGDNTIWKERKGTVQRFDERNNYQNSRCSYDKNFGRDNYNQSTLHHDGHIRQEMSQRPRGRIASQRGFRRGNFQMQSKQNDLERYETKESQRCQDYGRGHVQRSPRTRRGNRTFHREGLIESTSYLK